MQLKPEQLEAHLAKGAAALKPLYTLHGDEPLLVQEAADALRAAARAAGYSERKVFTVSGAHFDWSAVQGAAQAMSLFAERQLMEGVEGVLTGSNVGASVEAGEPRHGGKRGGHSVWVSWTAPAGGLLRLSTGGSSFDTTLSVFGPDGKLLASSGVSVEPVQLWDCTDFTEPTCTPSQPCDGTT